MYKPHSFNSSIFRRIINLKLEYMLVMGHIIWSNYCTHARTHARTHALPRDFRRNFQIRSNIPLDFNKFQFSLKTVIYSDMVVPSDVFRRCQMNLYVEDIDGTCAVK